MPTPEEDALRRRRQAYWLRTVRAFDPRKPTLAQAAKAAGLAETSGSVVSLWENDVAREGPKLSRLQRLAAFYGVPLRMFTEPDPTDEERIERLRDLGTAAAELALEDLAAGEGRGDPEAAAPLDDALRTQTA